MDKEIFPGFFTDGSGKHAFVEPGIQTMTLRPQKGRNLSEIRTLELPETLESFSGIEQFPGLRVIRYSGTSEIFSFEEPIRWLGRDTGDLFAFSARLATNLIPFRPVPPTLCAVIAPNMRPIQAGPGWKHLMAAMEEQVKAAEDAGGLRQDASRECVILCRSYTIFKHLQWCFSLGRALSTERYSTEAEAGYGKEHVFTPEEQLSLLLASAQGHIYEEFSGVVGDRRVGVMRDPQDFADERKRAISWRDNEQFRNKMLELLEDGLVTAKNYPALLDMLTRRRMTAATAMALRFGSRHPELRAQPSEEDFFL